MIEPFLRDEAFLDDVAAARGEAGRLHLWWLGQSGYLIQWRGIHLLVDPYLSDSLTEKYAATDKPHVRMTRRVVDPGRLDFVDVVTSSHHHTDHLDGVTLRALLAANPALEIVIPESIRQFASERIAIDPQRPVGLDDGAEVEVAGVRIAAVASAHETVERDEHGRCKFLGYVFRFGDLTIYHCGDTVLYDGMAARLRTHRVDLALLPINGSLPGRRVAGNLNGVEAACLAKDIGAKLVVPCHYDMFEFNTAPPGELELECRRLGQPCRILRAGERLTL